MKTETRDFERLHRAFVSLSETAQPTASCPDPERLWSASRGELPPGETREMIEHTAACPACAEAWRLAMHLSEEVPQEGAVPREEVARRRAAPAIVPWWRYAAVAAAVVFAVFGVSQMTDLKGPEPPGGLRNAGETGLLSEAAADAPLPRDAFVLRWRLQPPREGVRYTVRVTTEDFYTVYQAEELEEPVLRVPEAVLAELPSGSKLSWYVEASLADGGDLDAKTFWAVLE